MTNENKLSEREIDEIVIAQANDDNAWEEPINVKSAVPATVSLSPRSWKNGLITTPKFAVRSAF